jgi:arginine decarboxylase
VPDPARARVRAYSTQSTHKTLTSLRQGSMIHVHDQDFAQKVAESFHEAYMTHTSTSPNYQILASLDLGRRQAALEGYELV